MIKFHKIISFRKLTVKRRLWLNYSGTPPQLFLLKISEILRSFSEWWLAKLSQQRETFSNLAIKLRSFSKLI